MVASTAEDALDEAKLIQLARGGDAGAYGSLIEEHQALAFRAAYLITRSAEEAEEATQEAFVKAWRALDRFRAGAPFRPWLMRIVTNEARNRRRSQHRREGLATRAFAGSAAGQSAEDEALRADADARLLAEVEKLPEKQRLVLGYVFFLGLTEAETAKALGIARGTVKSRAARAKAVLREALAASGLGPAEEEGRA